MFPDTQGLYGTFTQVPAGNKQTEGLFYTTFVTHTSTYQTGEFTTG